MSATIINLIIQLIAVRSEVMLRVLPWKRLIWARPATPSLAPSGVLVADSYSVR
jgi:hypothetical protein